MDNLEADDLDFIDETTNSLENIYSYSNENTSDNQVNTMTKEISNTVNFPPQVNSILCEEDNSNSNYDKHRSVAGDLILAGSKTYNTHYENYQYDPSDNVEEISMDGLEIDEEEDVFSSPGIEAILIGKELNWDDPDEFDEKNDQENNDPTSIKEVDITGKLNRFEKSKQIANEVIQTHGWGKENMSLLEQVFFENGWGMARVSIERELNEGLIPEELELALFIRQLWAENQQYWISFKHITSNQPGQESRAAYKNMSWAESLRIVRSFNNVPSEEELQFFIYQIYDDWYGSTELQRQYKAFFNYLKYCTSLGLRSLPGNEIFSFVDSYYKESL